MQQNLSSSMTAVVITNPMDGELVRYVNVSDCKYIVHRKDVKCGKQYCVALRLVETLLLAFHDFTK
jgi:hypothetical protein